MSAISGLGNRAARWLEHPRLPLHLALVAVALCLPALGVGWQIDDNFHRVVLLGGPASGAGPLEMFSVLRERPELVGEYVDAGIFPWWTSPRFKIAFLRHLSAATAWLDYRLWPHSAPAQHAHSLLWLGAVVLAAAALYRRVEGAGTSAGLAALLFAVDDAHGTAAGWLANRNALVASLFGILCLLFHDRWRRGGRRADAVGATLLLALALAGGELALGTAGFLLAYALFVEPRGGWRRFASLAPYGLVLITWAAVYRGLGFGAAGSGLYLDPLGQPVRFVAAVIARLPFFLAGQLTPMAADLGSLAPAEHRWTLWTIAAALVAVIVIAVLPQVRASATARFWALGTILSVVPLCATFPTNRVLFFTGLGAMPLVARWLLDRPRGTLAGALAVFLVATHLVLAPILLPVTARVMKTFGAPIERAVLTLPSDPGLAGQDLILVNAPDYLTYVSQAPALFFFDGRPAPRRIRALAVGPSAVEVRRIDDHALELTMEDGFWGGPLGGLYRPPSETLPAGARIEVAGMTATVVAATAAGTPGTVRFRFDRPLASESARWVVFVEGSFEPFELPAAGASRRIPAALGPFDALLPSPDRR